MTIMHMQCTQWRILGRGLPPPRPLFLDQTETQKAEKKFLRPPPPPPCPLYLRVWMSTALPLPSFSEGLDPPLVHVPEVLPQSIESNRLGPD